jgi:hypothetical protein
MSAITRYFAALHAPSSVPHYIVQCRGIVTKMTGNPSFQKPTIDLLQVSKDIDEVDAAEQAAHQGPKGAIAVRDIKLLVVRSDMRQLKEYVQGCADADLGNAVAIIEGAGMYVVKRVTKGRGAIEARYGKVSGSVELTVKAHKGRVAYKWQMSTDQLAWSDLPESLVSTITISGLTPVTVYFFRFRTVTKAGLSDWSTAVSIVAH